MAVEGLSFQESCTVVARAQPHAALGASIHAALTAVSTGARADRNAAAGALRSYIDARVRARRIPAADAEAIASDIELKILERPELFLAADNPAAYIAVSIRYRWLTHLRTEERARRREQKEAEEAARSEDDDDDEQDVDPLGAALELRAARADLEIVAGRVVERAAEEVREQQAETWKELVDLASKRRTMDTILRAHRPDAEGDLERDRALKVLRDRVLQRHQRMRKRMVTVIEEMGGSEGWTPERVRRASLALRQLFVRCQRRPSVASSGREA